MKRDTRSTSVSMAVRRGLTLLELVVVLAILAALAGLVLPLAGTYLEKAHAGAASDNFKEIAKVVQQYNTVTRAQPDSLDSLQSALGTVYASLPGGGSYLSAATTLTQDQLDAMTEAGVTTFMLHDNGTPESATFDSTSTASALALGSNVVTVAAADVADQLGYTSDTAGTPVLALFGLGHDNSLIGDWLQEAPYHFPEGGNPNVIYNRFALVYDISEEDNGGAANGDARFQFVGVVSLHDDGIVGPLEPLIEFYEQ